MNYRHIYMIIITKAKNEMQQGIRVKGNGNYYERHHILPKSIFSLWTKRKSNIVLLTAREHFFCHQLLAKIYPGSKMSFALVAFTTRPNADYKISSKEYERLKKLHSTLRKGKSTMTEESKKIAVEKCRKTKERNGTLHMKASEEKKKAISETLKQKYATGEIVSQSKGTRRTEDQKIKISNTLKSKYEDGQIIVWNKGKECPSSQKFGEDNGMFGKTWWTNGIDNIAAFECPEGYHKGFTPKVDEEKEALRKKKISESSKGRKWFNNGIQNKFCFECPDGYVPGFICKRWQKLKDEEDLCSQ